MGLMTDADAGRIPEVGVFVEDEQPAAPTDRPLIGKDGRPVKALIYDKTKFVLMGSSPICLPPTYQVRSYF